MSFDTVPPSAEDRPAGAGRLSRLEPPRAFNGFGVAALHERLDRRALPKGAVLRASMTAELELGPPPARLAGKKGKASRFGPAATTGLVVALAAGLALAGLWRASNAAPGDQGATRPLESAP